MTLREAGSRRKSLRYDERWSRRELWYAFYRTCFFFLFHVHSYMWIAYSILLVIPLGDMDSSFSTISAQLMVWVWWWEIGCSSLPSSSPPPPPSQWGQGGTRRDEKNDIIDDFLSTRWAEAVEDLHQSNLPAARSVMGDFCALSV